jgi:hypothetical protein
MGDAAGASAAHRAVAHAARRGARRRPRGSHLQAQQSGFACVSAKAKQMLNGKAKRTASSLVLSRTPYISRSCAAMSSAVSPRCLRGWCGSCLGCCAASPPCCAPPPPPPLRPRSSSAPSPPCGSCAPCTRRTRALRRTATAKSVCPALWSRAGMRTSDAAAQHAPARRACPPPLPARPWAAHRRPAARARRRTWSRGRDAPRCEAPSRALRRSARPPAPPPRGAPPRRCKRGLERTLRTTAAAERRPVPKRARAASALPVRLGRAAASQRRRGDGRGARRRRDARRRARTCRCSTCITR